MRKMLVGSVLFLVLPFLAGTILAHEEAPTAETPHVEPTVESGDDTAPPAEPRGVALVAVGAVDAALVERVRAFVEHNLALPVRVAAPLEPDAESATLSDVMTRVAAALTSADVCVVGVVQPGFDAAEHSIYDYEKRAGVINARILAPDPEDAELFGRRVEKLVVRSYGLLLGGELVPMPYSALYPYQNLQELDQIARTLDPPSLVRVQRNAVEQGVRLLETSPFNLQ